MNKDSAVILNAAWSRDHSAVHRSAGIRALVPRHPTGPTMPCVDGDERSCSTNKILGTMKKRVMWVAVAAMTALVACDKEDVFPFGGGGGNGGGGNGQDTVVVDPPDSTGGGGNGGGGCPGDSTGNGGGGPIDSTGYGGGGGGPIDSTGNGGGGWPYDSTGFGG
jgi:hypothetical protein